MARDLFVRSPDSRGAAACTIWAVMAEGLRRMRAAGMRRASLVFNPNNMAARALYMSIGFSGVALFCGVSQSALSGS
jgi:predicted GNAT family acetyltransferase